MIAFLVVVYTSVVVVLFKFKLLKPRPYPIACTVVAGVLLIGGVFVAWMLCAPLSPNVVTTQYVIQLVPYVKGQVLKVHAQANQPVKKGDLLLEINPAPYQYTVNQAQAQLNVANANVEQAKAGLQAAVDNPGSPRPRPPSTRPRQPSPTPRLLGTRRRRRTSCPAPRSRSP